MSRLNRIYTQLSEAGKNTKTKLSKKRSVKLSLIDKIYTQRDYLKDAADHISYMTSEYLPEMEKKLFDIRRDIDNFIVNSDASSIEDFLSEMQDLVKELKSGADALGVPIDEVYDEYPELEDEIKYAEQMLDELDNMEKNFEIVFRLTNLR